MSSAIRLLTHADSEGAGLIRVSTGHRQEDALTKVVSSSRYQEGLLRIKALEKEISRLELLSATAEDQLDQITIDGYLKGLRQLKAFETEISRLSQLADSTKKLLEYLARSAAKNPGKGLS
jgi:hypothetical protein